jgi:hypothetical protein
MTSQEASDYVRKYQELMADDDKRGGRRNPALLPTSKENILAAIKLEIAQFYFLNAATEERVQPLIRAAMFIDSFTDETLDTATFVEDMQSRRKDMQGFYSELIKVKRSDAFYWQRIYALVGVSLETKSHTFFQNLKLQLGIGITRGSNSGQTTIFRGVDEPYVLD